ncbi:MAG: VOC family protein [Thermoplasmata archaeon]|nr:VOC family protein [Thermoplasmata archaeon]
MEDADLLRQFYSEVAGWRAEEFDGDFNMFTPGSPEPEAGICYARGPNARLPPQWLLYIAVGDLERSAGMATSLGGKVLDGPRPCGNGRICVIQDPAGAVAALYQANTA